MKNQSAIHVLVALPVLLWSAALPAQAKSPRYLTEMPSVARVKTGIKGKTARETAARRMGAFWQLQKIVEALAGPRTYRNQLTPDERRLLGRYRSAYYSASKPYLHIQNTLSSPDRPTWYQLHAFYETDPGFRDELLRRLCSAKVRRAYYKAAGGKPFIHSAMSRARGGALNKAEEAEKWMRALQKRVVLLAVLSLLVYFAPTLAGGLRAWKNPAYAASPWLILLWNLLLGGTVIGWLLAWPLALGWWRPGSRGMRTGEPLAWQPTAPVGGESAMPIWETQLPTWEPASPTWEAQSPAWEPPAPEATNSCCGGQGQVCPSCGGSRGSWVLPQTEHGVAQWVSCSYCNGSGRVQCGICGSG